MISLKRLRSLEAVLREAGHGPIIELSETIVPTTTADAFGEHAIYVICNSGMRNSIAVPIFSRCMAALRGGGSAAEVFGHPGKRAAIDTIWTRRHELFEAFLAADDQLAFLQALPWIGPVTTYHLAKNLGADFAKPDVHLERLARRERTTTQKLCSRLARQTGYRSATIDTILWRACADGLLDSKTYELRGWHAAYDPARYLARRVKPGE